MTKKKPAGKRVASDAELERPRPKGFDYSIPDSEGERCLVCNKQGINRTGFVVLGFSGASTTVGVGVRCPEKCANGLRNPLAQDSRL